MHGSSVCNKLKKDAGLKEVPLIIMSSESSDETFEQHKKLRTRAEDYIHKPIAFGELLRHIQGFVQIGADASSEAEASIVIEEDIESGDYLSEESIVAVSEPPKAPEPKDKVDADVEAFAESAFGRLTEPEPQAPQAASNGAAEARAPRRSAVPAPKASVRPSHAAAVPAAVGVEPAEHRKVVGELARAKERAAAAETDLAQAKREIDKLKLDTSENDHLAAEIVALKLNLAQGATQAGGVPTR